MGAKEYMKELLEHPHVEFRRKLAEAQPTCDETREIMDALKTLHRATTKESTKEAEDKANIFVHIV